jgi:replicative DNA helicase
MALFTFEPGFQRSILRLMMVDEAFCLRALDYVEAGFFTQEALGWIFTVIEQYWRSYQTCCPDVALRDALRYAKPEKLPYYSAEVENVILLGIVSEALFIKEKLADFCRRNVFSIAHKESATLFNMGEVAKAYDAMAHAQDRIREITFEEVDRQWFFEELSDRQRQRFQNQMKGWGAFKTGIPDLDLCTDGGVHAGELWAVIAYAKRGKTTWMINQGFNAIRMFAVPVLHIVLEGMGDQISARYDSLFSQELYTKVKLGEIDPQTLRILQEEYARLRELLVIRTMNDWDVNVGHIRAELDELKSTRKFKPVLMITDYADLLRSRYKSESETQHQVEATRDLKRLHNQTGLGGWTGFQAQRPKPGAHEKEHILSSASVADAYAKIRIVDSYGSINMTDQEMREGEMRVYWEGHRDAPVNRCWKVLNDMARMRMVTEIITEKVEDQKQKSDG